MAGRILRGVHAAENALSALALVLLVLIPFVEVVARMVFHTGISGSVDYTQHLVLVATFLAGAVTSREKRHLSMALDLGIREPLKTHVATAVAVVGGAFCLAFAWSSLGFSLTGFEAGQRLGILSLRTVSLIMVAGYLVMGVRFVAGLEKTKRRGLWLATAFAVGTALAFPSAVKVAAAAAGTGEAPSWIAAAAAPLGAGVAAAASPLIVLLIVSAFFGTPLFVVLGGCAYLLFARQALPLEVVPNQAYSMLTGFSMAAIPLFTVTGFLLSESKAGERLIRLFKAFFSWFPGGLAVMAVFVCAFFTTFTGASGVTIVALGGLLFYILTGAGYGRAFTVGLLTASGSIGLLFPPSLPVIIYGVISKISIKEMYMGGILPGTAMVLALVVISVVYAARAKVERHAFALREALAGVRDSIWEILLPIIIFLGYFGLPGRVVVAFGALLVLVLAVEHILGRGQKDAGLGRSPLSFIATVAGVVAVLAAAGSVALTLVESAAVAALYTFLVQVVVHHDLKPKDLLAALNKSLPIIGGTLTILALANGLSYYIIDAEIPTKLAAWVLTAVSSKYVFLLIVNLVLLVVGCFMDIYSAILVVAPLIIPLGEVFHIHPVHLGIIFLANMELGYLTPPVGLNLYLSSYRFNEPMVRVFKDVRLFLLVHAATVLVITYVPFLTTLLLKG